MWVPHPSCFLQASPLLNDSEPPPFSPTSTNAGALLASRFSNIRFRRF